MARRRMTLNLHETVSITIARDCVDGTTTRWTNVTVVDQDENEYEITCFGSPKITIPQDEQQKEASNP